MSLTRRHKLVIAGLLLYWPAMLVATHISCLPSWIGCVPGSDKTLHFTAYLFLSFLLWFTVNPHKKVSWRKPAAWLILAAVIWYGAIDEWSQTYFGRQADIWDFAADAAGILFGLLTLTFVAFWPAALTLTWIGIFIAANLIRKNPALLGSELNIAFYLCSYGLLSILWQRYIHNFLSTRPPALKWIFVSLILPTTLLLVLEIFCVACGFEFNPLLPLAALVGIAAAVSAAFVIEHFEQKKKNSSAQAPA